MKFFWLFLLLSVIVYLKAEKEDLLTCEFISDKFIVESGQGIVLCASEKCTLTRLVQLSYETKISFCVRQSDEADSEPSLELKLNEQTIWTIDTFKSNNHRQWRFVEIQLPPLKFNISFVAKRGISIQKITLETDEYPILSTQSPTEFVQLINDVNSVRGGMYLKIFLPIGTLIGLCVLVVVGYVIIVKSSYKRRQNKADKQGLVSAIGSKI